MFAAGSSDVDVVMVDVVWPGIIGQHLLDLAPYAKDEVKKHFPAIIANNTVQGRLVAMPWFTAVGLLYYRKDLLEKYELSTPTTWDEFAKAAATIQEDEQGWHMFSVFLNGKGGKGVATWVGAFAAISFSGTVLCGVAFLLALYVYNYVSLASMIMVAAMPLVLLFQGLFGVVPVAVALVVLVFWSSKDRKSVV